MPPPRFGISTHLFHAARLDRTHLVEVAAHGFECLEVFATRSHFDYHDPAAVAALAEWLDDTRLTLHSIHAPVNASFIDGVWGETFSNAARDDERRRRALREAEAAVSLARSVPFRYLVVHLGVPDTQGLTDDNARDAARRSVEAMHEVATAAGVQLALEVIPNKLSQPEPLVAFIEEELEGLPVGICVDVGHAHMLGDVVDAIECCSGHIVTTHLHDNRRKRDDHLMPGDGSIDWPAALMSFQKVGYDGVWMFEVANTSDPMTVLNNTRRVRERFEQLLDLNFSGETASDNL